MIELSAKVAFHSRKEVRSTSMDLDFSKITGTSTSDSLVDPRAVFASLPAKDARYNYLRDVQSEVLDEWFSRRNETDLRLKMNTGGGKTLVGLLILKSSLNEESGPAVYIAPTPFLVDQVVSEATKLGLAVEKDPRALSVARGKAILVTSINTLLNGKSKFGVAPGPPEIEIGTLVLDDAHACLATADEQFTLNLPWTHAAYDKLRNLFEASLEEQSPSRLHEVISGEPNKYAMVPFWAWQDKIKDAYEILFGHKDDKELQFTWPLISENLRHCRCVFGDQQVEITPPCLPISVIPSFVLAKRRVFMSATFADDSILISHFNANPDAITEAITPKTASDLGERMILVPQELDPTITDEEIRGFASEQAKRRNVVVIVPSKYRSRFWTDVASKIVPPDNLQDSVQELIAGHIGLVVFVNRYDGIDLPHDACRLLILDGLPDVRRTIDKLEQACLYGTSLAVTRSVQLIEQGMGRGVRANDDHCAVLLMGRTLVGSIYRNNGIHRFTPATRAQFELSEQVGDQIRGKGLAGIDSAFEYCFARDPKWVGASKAAIAQAKHVTTANELQLARHRRLAFNLAYSRDFAGAELELQKAKNLATEPAIQGWLGWQLAEIKCFANPSDAQQVLSSAVKANMKIPVRPFVGIAYARIGEAAQDQSEACLEFLRSRFAAANDLLVEVNAILDDLDFRPDSYKRFERALANLAPLLGYESQTPEESYGAGPDVLWSVGGLAYWVIECKNEATATTVSKGYVNQLAGSINWFKATYDQTCTSTPFIVHPSDLVDHAATPPEGARVINIEKLGLFREAVRRFAIGASTTFRTCGTKDIAMQLTSSKLLAAQFVEQFSVSPRASR